MCDWEPRGKCHTLKLLQTFPEMENVEIIQQEKLWMKIKREDKRRMKYLTRYCLFRAQCIQQQIGICKSSQKRRRRGLDGGWFGEILDIFIAFLFTRAKMRGVQGAVGCTAAGEEWQKVKDAKTSQLFVRTFQDEIIFCCWLSFGSCMIDFWELLI